MPMLIFLSPCDHHFFPIFFCTLPPQAHQLPPGAFITDEQKILKNRISCKKIVMQYVLNTGKKNKNTMHQPSDLTATYSSCCSIGGSLSNLINHVRKTIHAQFTQLTPSWQATNPELAGEQRSFINDCQLYPQIGQIDNSREGRPAEPTYPMTSLTYSNLVMIFSRTSGNSSFSRDKNKRNSAQAGTSRAVAESTQS